MSLSSGEIKAAGKMHKVMGESEARFVGEGEAEQGLAKKHTTP